MTVTSKDVESITNAISIVSSVVGSPAVGVVVKLTSNLIAYLHRRRQAGEDPSQQDLTNEALARAKDLEELAHASGALSQAEEAFRRNR